MKASLSLVLGLSLVFALPSKAAPVDYKPVTEGLPVVQASAYFGVRGGMFWLPDVRPGAGPLSVDFKFKPGVSLGLPFGYDFGNGFRVGFSVGYDSSHFGSVTGHYGGGSQSAASRGSATFIPLMMSAAYSFSITNRLKWSLGVGAGMVHEDVQFGAYDYPASKSIIFGQLGRGGNAPLVSFDGISNKEWNFAYEVFTGLSYDLSSNISLELGYRYLQLGDKISVNGGSGTRLNGQSVDLNVLVKF